MAQRFLGCRISLLLCWAGAKVAAMAEFGNDGGHGGKASIWAVTYDAEASHDTPRPR